MFQNSFMTNELFSFFEQNPAFADMAFYGRVAHTDKRGFLNNEGLQTMKAMLGAQIPHHRNMPAGFVPAAFAKRAMLIGKNGMMLVNERAAPLRAAIGMGETALSDPRHNSSQDTSRTTGKATIADWKLTIDGSVESPKTYKINELGQQFETVTMALATEHQTSRDMPMAAQSNAPSQHAAVGCAEWTGVRLRDVLKAAGFRGDCRTMAQPFMSEQSEVPSFATGIPASKAMTDNVLIAWSQNGGEIPLMDGAPLRLVVPGWPDESSYKRLTRIHLESKGPCTRCAPEQNGMRSDFSSPYKMATCPKFSDLSQVNEKRLPVKSIITSPQSGARAETVTEIRGHAWSGDRTVNKVEVSTDFGKTWQSANLHAPVNTGAWQNWRAHVRFPTNGYYEVWCRSTDSEGDTQPFAIDWNPNGSPDNTIHRIGLIVD